MYIHTCTKYTSIHTNILHRQCIAVTTNPLLFNIFTVTTILYLLFNMFAASSCSVSMHARSLSLRLDSVLPWMCTSSLSRAQTHNEHMNKPIEPSSIAAVVDLISSILEDCGRDNVVELQHNFFFLKLRWPAWRTKRHLHSCKMYWNLSQAV